MSTIFASRLSVRFVKSVSVVAIAAALAGCASDTVRFSDGFYTGAVPKQPSRAVQTPFPENAPVQTYQPPSAHTQAPPVNADYTYTSAVPQNSNVQRQQLSAPTTAAANLEPGQILLLENLRFHKEETAGDVDFAKQLSKLGDIYVNDAFGTAHRAHASTTIVAQFFTENKCFGNLLAQEIESIKKVMETGEKPVLAVLGGAKVSTKIDIIKNLINKSDAIFLGGGMANTFLAAQNFNIGSSLCENSLIDTAKEILELAETKNCKLIN